MKTVILHNAKFLETIYSERDLQSIRELGEVVINTDASGPDKERVKELIKGADAVITSWGCPKIDEEVLKEADKLKVLLHAAGSIKGIICPEFKERRIRVSNGAEMMGKGVAETALGMTIASLKNMWGLSASIRQGEWAKGKEKVKELYDIKIGVIGAGYAGSHYIKLLQNFDVKVLLYDPILSKSQVAQMGAEKVELDELLKNVDLVSIHAPSIPATYRMLNRERLALMKDDAIIINTARGSIIDEAALIDELSKGRLFACLDVTDPEPPVAENPLRTIPNAILTPHLAGNVNNGLKRVGRYIAGDLKLFAEGKQMRGEIDYSKLDTLA